MLRWAVIFFIIALVAAAFGFAGMAAASAGIAKILFFISWFFFCSRFLGIYFGGRSTVTVARFFFGPHLGSILQF